MTIYKLFICNDIARAPSGGTALVVLSIVTRTNELKIQPRAELPVWASHALEAGLTGAEAGEVLLRLAGDAIRAKDPDCALRLRDAGTRLAGAPAIRYLLDSAQERSAGLATLAVALRFRGPEVVGPVLERLHACNDLAGRRVFLQLALALSRFPELRQALVERLLVQLDAAEWYVVRNAIGLLSDIGGDVPARHDLATHSHRQVRLALAKALARRPQDTSALDVLIFLLGDPDISVRYSTVVALGAADTPRARMALSQHAEMETDPETLQATRAIIRRRDELRIA